MLEVESWGRSSEQKIGENGVFYYFVERVFAPKKIILKKAMRV
jgi:hypothetical protein